MKSWSERHAANPLQFSLKVYIQYKGHTIYMPRIDRYTPYGWIANGIYAMLVRYTWFDSHGCWYASSTPLLTTLELVKKAETEDLNPDLYLRGKKAPMCLLSWSLVVVVVVEGCYFSSDEGLRSFEHPLKEVTAVPRVESDGQTYGSTFKVNFQRTVPRSPRPTNSLRPWAVVWMKIPLLKYKY
jgi:hypothetical protein